MNNILVSGFLVDQPEIREIKDGKKICNFTMGVPRTKEKVDFFKVVCFGEKAELCNKWLKKGSKIIVGGQMQNEQYTGKDNKRHDGWQITMSMVEFLSKIRKYKDDVEVEEDDELLEVTDPNKNREANELFSAFGNTQLPF